MPIYEYRCGSCRRKVTVLTLRASETVQPECDRCGSRDLSRLMSRFALVRSEESRLDSLADDSSLGGLDENDPKSMARWMKRVGSELGDELGGGELDEMVDSMESGAADGGDDDAGGAGGCGSGGCGGGGCDVD